MEVSVIGSFKAELTYRELGFCNLKGGKTVSSKNRVCFGRSTGWRKSGIRFTLRATAAIQSEPLRSDSVSGRSRRSNSSAGLKLQKEPSIFFADRTGQQYKECLSLTVDDLPVLAGKTPVQVYREFCESFKSSFSSFMGSTITGISMGLGPDGELRYPSHHRLVKSNKITGVGEFQCYDKNMPNETQAQPSHSLISSIIEEQNESVTYKIKQAKSQDKSDTYNTNGVLRQRNLRLCSERREVEIRPPL